MIKEQQIEESLIAKLQELKYTYRDDIRDKSALKKNFAKGKRQNQLRDNDINKVVDFYQYRKEEERYARRVSLKEIEKNGFNLNISRYVSTAKPEPIIDIVEVNTQLHKIEEDIKKYTDEHNEYLKELGLDLLPTETQ